jgi:hypothetical protein
MTGPEGGATRSKMPRRNWRSFHRCSVRERRSQTIERDLFARSAELARCEKQQENRGNIARRVRASL